MLPCEAIQSAAAQAGAQAAGCFALGNDALNDAVGVLHDLVERNAHFAGVTRQDIRWKARLLLIEINGQQFEPHRGSFLQRHQDIQQRVGILAA